MPDRGGKDAPTSAREGAAKTGHEQDALSDEVVEETKREILFGVGYKRPPERTRFKKGQSGNPKGRPKSGSVGPHGSRSANALALREANRLIAVRDGGETKLIPSIEAVFRSQILSAVKGNAYSQKQAIERYDWAEHERRASINEENEFWRLYVAECRRAIAESESKDEAAPVFLPHPDDVKIDDENGVRFIGPVDAEGAAKLEETCQLRDVLLLQDALDRRDTGDTVSNDPLDGPGTTLLFALILNNGVPRRFRLSDGKIVRRIMQYEGVPKRELLKRLYRAWRAIGCTPLRGFLFPPLRRGKQLLEMLADASWEVAASVPERPSEN